MNEKERASAALGRELVERGHLTEARLATAWDYRRAAGIPLAEALHQLGFIEPSLLVRIESERARAAEIRIGPETVARDLISKIPRILLAQSTALPIHVGGDVVIASLSPIEPLIRDDLERLAGRRLEFVHVRDAATRRVLEGLAAEMLRIRSDSPIGTPS
ncbi:MAG: hypothetical protein JXP34_01450 [Planctomycetes bacterium]|nr:hypothetical protein [Planctomycetota bacterium]